MKLNELLSPELYAQVQAEIDKVNAGQSDKTKHVRFADLSEGGYVSVDKFNSQINNLTQQVNALQGQLNQRDADIGDLQSKLAAAQADASKLSDAQSQLSAMQTKYDDDRRAWEANAAKQRKEFAIRENAGKLKFSSAAAKRDFISHAIEKDFPLDGETLMGYEEFLTKYKADDPSAFIEEQPAPEEPAAKPNIVLPNSAGSPVRGKTLADMMKAKNANPDMIVSFEN